jgi:hypothetical protein
VNFSAMFFAAAAAISRGRGSTTIFANGNFLDIPSSLQLPRSEVCSVN